MYIRLLKRQKNIQRLVKELWRPCRLEQLFHPEKETAILDESMLLAILPPDWLPVPHDELLVSIAHAKGSTGLRNLRIFRPWARHFDCYILELWHDALHP